jgi:DNA polymerase-3 subunit delta'
MSTEAANCLLKTLEEPAAGVVFILLTTSDSALLATVVSRCQKLELPPMPAAEVEAVLSQRWGVEQQRAGLLARLCHGCLGWAVSAASDERLLELHAERLEGLLSIISGDYEVRFNYVTQLVAWFGQSRGLVQEVLDLWLEWWRDLLLVKLGSSSGVTNIDHQPALVDMARGYRLEQIRAVINGIQATGEQLRQNANPRLAFEVLMLNIPEGRGG